MFKGIIPSKRISNSEFSMITNIVDQNGKENYPTGVATAPPTKTTFGKQSNMSKPQEKKKKTEQQKQTNNEEFEIVNDVLPDMHTEFDRLLDDLQIPTSLRPKLLGMDSTVKAAMLKSSQTMTLKGPSQAPIMPPQTPRAASLRRAHSIESISSPRRDRNLNESQPLEPPMAPFSLQVSAHHPSSLGNSPTPRKASGHSRNISMDAPAMFSRSQVNLASSSTADLGTYGKERVPNNKVAPTKNISPTRFFSLLSGRSSLQLEVEDMKKLRLLLRNESASWSQEFLSLGGYSALLTRLNEILEVEWREEQHDDKVLHELLRCLKALSTSAIGCFALRSSCPTPFVQLVALLYSDKKPGDVATRQLIVDLLLILFDLYPSSALPSFGDRGSVGRSRLRREAWESESATPSNVITLPSPHKNMFSLIRALLLTPAPPPSESPANPVSPHAFIENLHRPRIYKTYLQELSDVCRDYFWVFCHPNNTIWNLEDTDESKVEKPRAPGGMTGGVEFEAMQYFTTHLKLLNAVGKAAASLNLPKNNEDSAYHFHEDLFLSGLERIILISRKASTTYYPTLHLELSRYIAQAIEAGYELPYTINRLIGFPPTAMIKNTRPPRDPYATPTKGSQPSTPTRRGGNPPPALPSPRKLEPLKY